MSNKFAIKLLWTGGAVLALWLAARYILPIAVPFLLGAVLSWAAEPGVRFLRKKLHWRRLPAVGVCVSVTLLLFAGALSVVGAVAVREMGAVAKLAPDIGQTVGDGLVVLEDVLISWADRAPDNIRTMLISSLTDTFQNGTALVKQVTGKLPGVVANLVGKFSRGALTLGTGILAGFMISARLPVLKQKAQSLMPQRWKQELLPALRRVRHTFGRWLCAQLKLMGITWLIVAAGFLLLGIRWGLLWAAAVALVDAVPVLGTGTVLVPWAVVSFLQGDTLRGVGLLAIFGASWLARSVLEPRLVGKSLGLDPLLSLAAFYAGFRLWGIPGMILAPVSAALIKGLLESGKPFTNNS